MQPLLLLLLLPVILHRFNLQKLQLWLITIHFSWKSHFHAWQLAPRHFRGAAQWPHRTLLYKNKTNVVTSLLYANKIRKAQCLKKSLKGFGNSKKCVIQSEYFWASFTHCGSVNPQRKHCGFFEFSLTNKASSLKGACNECRFTTRPSI